MIKFSNENNLSHFHFVYTTYRYNSLVLGVFSGISTISATRTVSADSNNQSVLFALLSFSSISYIVLFHSRQSF